MTEADDGPIRLAKRLAALRGCSRGEAERYIEGGWVRVDGQTVEDPATRVAPSQAVTLDADASLLVDGPVTLVLHKPAGVADAASLLTPQARSPRDGSGIRVLRRHFNALTALALLPAEAAGLTVFTQDGRVRRRLAEDAGLLEHEFMADVAGPVDDAALQALRQRVQASISSTGEGRTRLRLAFKGMAPAQLAALLGARGLQLRGLTRQRLGRVGLGGLAPGQWRYLLASERF